MGEVIEVVEVVPQERFFQRQVEMVSVPVPFGVEQCIQVPKFLSSNRMLQ